MQATSRTIIRAWNKEGYHKDIAILDSDQVRMHSQGMEPKASQVMAGPTGAISLVVNPADFPEMEKFEVIVQRYEVIR